MRDSIYRITLDIHHEASQLQITAKKGDSARELHITLTENGLPYQIGAGCSAIIMIKKPDGNILANDCDIRLTDSTIIYEFTSQTVITSGLCECELRLIGTANDIITSPRFTMRVADTVYDDGQIESESEFTALTEAISAANNLDCEVSKEGGITTLTITKKDGTTETVQLYDGDIDVETLLAMLATKADKVPGLVNGHIAMLNSSGNLADSGVAVNSKANKVSNATSGHLATLDSNGDIADSGHSLSEYQPAFSIKTVWSNPVSDSNIASEKLVKDTIDNVREVAEGKCASYVISVEDNPDFDVNDNFIIVTSDIILSDGTLNTEPITGGTATVPLSDLRVGDVIYCVETLVPDRWVSECGPNAAVLWKLETTKVDLTSKADKVSVPTTNNICTLKADGGYKDSGMPISNITLWSAGTTDIGEGSTLTSGLFYAVYEEPSV